MMRGILKLSSLLLVLASESSSSSAQEPNPNADIAGNVDFYIFNEIERRFLSNHPPLYKFTSLERHKDFSDVPEVELTLREIELKKFEGETEEEFIERAHNLHSELVERPENFQERARNLSASRSRFRAGLLTPLTGNQLDPEIEKEVMKLDSLQLSPPIKIGDSIFLLRREGARSSVKLGQ